jgi:ElaA protein
MNWSIKHFDQLSTQELYAIFQLRLAVFSVEQNCPYQDADGKDQASFHVIATNDKGELVAYARVVNPGISYAEVSIGRVVTAAEVRKTGIGKELMTYTIDFIKQQFGTVPIRISAQCYLTRFYESFGFSIVGEEYEEDHIPHIEMLLSVK